MDARERAGAIVTSVGDLGEVIREEREKRQV
jgi:hypothetical protein